MYEKLNIYSQTLRGGISRGRGGDTKRFLRYFLYAFAIPLIITICVFLIDIANLSDELSYFKPSIGTKRCWVIENRIVEAIYVYAPISVILIINIVLYAITAFRIFIVQRETSVVRHGESQKHSKSEDTDRWVECYFR